MTLNELEGSPQESLGVKAPEVTERKVFDPKTYEFDTLPYTRIPDDDEFDMQQYINGFVGEGGPDHQHHAEEKDIKGRNCQHPSLTSILNMKFL